MMLDIWIVVDPKGDRPYVSTTPPTTLDRKGGTVKVYKTVVGLPDPMTPDGNGLVISTMEKT